MFCFIGNALNHLLKKTLDASNDFGLEEGGHYLVEGICLAFFRCISGFWDEGVDYETISKYMSKAAAESKASKRDVDVDADDLGDDFKPIQECWDLKFADDYLKKWIQLCRARIFGASSPAVYTEGNGKLDLVVPLMSTYELKIVESILVVVRNLSFVSSNARFLTHSPDLLRLLVGCLHVSSPSFSLIRRETQSSDDTNTGRSGTNLFCLHVIHTLGNLSQTMDITGRKLFWELILMDRNDDNRVSEDVRSLLPPYQSDIGFGMSGWYVARRFDTKDESISKVPNEFVYSLCGDHIQATAIVFPLLMSVLDETPTRTVLMGSLELFRDFAEIAEHHKIFANMPHSLLRKIVNLLWIPRLGLDSMDYIDPKVNIVTRVNTQKFTGGYDSMVDFEIRDRCLDLLEKLSGHSADMKRRLGEGNLFPRIYDYLLCALSTQVGRSDASQVAGKVLVNLALVPENRQGLMYVQGKLLRLASKDTNIANITYNSILTQLY